MLHTTVFNKLNMPMVPFPRIFILFVFITPGIEAQFELADCRHCPDGWVYFESSCYLFGDDDDKFTWTEATHHCDLHHSHLAVIDNAREDAFVRGFAKRLIKTVSDRKRDAFWLGATDEITEGIWTWYTDDSNLAYTNWDHGQPDSHGHNNEDCLYLYDDDFLWHDGPCSSKIHAICELSLIGDSTSIIG